MWGGGGVVRITYTCSCWSEHYRLKALILVVQSELWFALVFCVNFHLFGIYLFLFVIVENLRKIGYKTGFEPQNYSDTKKITIPN